MWKKHPKYFWGDQLDVRYYLCEQISKLHNKKILDIGCNIGIISSCADSTNEIIGIDLNEEAINTARQLNPNNTYLEQDLWKYKNSQFDVVIFSNMIEMFPQAERKKLIQHISQYLKKGGTLYLTTPNRLNNFYKNSSNKLTIQAVQESITPFFEIKQIQFWNPISIYLHHLAKFPGAYTLIKYLSKLINSKKSVSIYLEVQKL